MYVCVTLSYAILCSVELSRDIGLFLVVGIVATVLVHVLLVSCCFRVSAYASFSLSSKIFPFFFPSLSFCTCLSCLGFVEYLFSLPDTIHRVAREWDVPKGWKDAIGRRSD